MELRVPPYEPSEVLESGTELLSGMSEIPRLQFHCEATDLHVNKLISSWFVVFPVQIYQSSIIAGVFPTNYIPTYFGGKSRLFYCCH